MQNCVKCNKMRTAWCNSLGPPRQMFLPNPNATTEQTAAQCVPCTTHAHHCNIVVTMMLHAIKRGFKDCPGFLNSTGRLGLHCATCAPLVQPLKGHRWGTGPKRCPARARRTNVPPLDGAHRTTSWSMWICSSMCPPPTCGVVCSATTHQWRTTPPDHGMQTMVCNTDQLLSNCNPNPSQLRGASIAAKHAVSQQFAVFVFAILYCRAFFKHGGGIS